MKTIKNLTADELRKSILQLAIQGKLVKQDPNDEPASELVKRIYEEKNKLIAEGKIKKDKNQSFIFKGDDNCYYEKIGNNDPVKLENLPFDIPNNWTWIRQKNICWLDNGLKTKGDKLPYLEAKVIRGLKQPIILDEGVIVNCNQRVILVDGENSGEIMIPPYEGYMGSTFKIFSATNFYNYNFLLFIFLLNKNLYKNSKVGAAIPHLNKDIFRESFIVVPPLGEQQRIVDKINSFEPLLEKYDKVEKELSKLEKEFPEKLKKSILQYAIEGKLVKQDPNDEPASVLLERIKQEKERLIKEGKIKRDKNESYIYQGDDKNYYENINNDFILKEVPYAIHTCWFWSELGQVVNIINGFTPSRSNSDFWKEGSIPWMTVEDLNIQGNYFSSTIQHITHKALKSKDRIIPKNSTFICCTSATIGRTAINLIPATSNQQFNGLVIKQHISNYLDNNYLFIFCKTLKHKLIEMAGITTFPFVSVEKLSKILIPIPPLKEQIKIVNKINKLEIFLK